MKDAEGGVEVRLDDGGGGAPKYDTTAPSALRAEERLAGRGDAKGRTARLDGRTTGNTRKHSASRGSIASETQTRASFLIAAVTENRVREIGICAIDLVAPHELLLWNVIDSHSYAESLSLLQAFQPIEILLVDSAKPQRVNDAIDKRFARAHCRVVPIARKYFDQTKGAEDLKRIVANRVDLNITRNYVAMAALSCTMRYVEFIQGVYIAEKTMKLVLNASMNKLLMDQATVAALELVQCARGDSTRLSLWGILNNTQTSAGNRLLRSTMLQPPCHLPTIHSRHEVIATFLNHPGWFFDLLEQLPNFIDLDRLLGQLVLVPKLITPRMSRLAIGNVIALKQTLENLPSLVQCLESTASNLDPRCPLLDSICASLGQDQFTTIREDIERVINERVKVSRSAALKRIQECFAVRAGIDGMLDVARRTYLDTIEKIHELVHIYKEKLDAPVKLNYTSRRGYHLIVPSNVKDLPSSIIERVPGKKATSCSTKELNSLNARLNESLTAVYKLSNGVIQDLLDKIRPRATILYAMVESIGLLDMLLSFTNVVALSPADQPYVRPRVCQDGPLVVKDGRHPLVENAMKDQTFVANNTLFDPASTFHGPNCAGKSTYMKSIAIITILAHMGSYVPAKDAFIPLRDRICTRFGTSDDMEENASTFAVEMSETSFILESCTSRSLVLIDELGRGTANDEGFAIAWSISEQFIMRRCYTCFATHYHDMNQLASHYPNCKRYHMSATATTSYMRFRYKLVDGPFPMIDMYGIKTAKMCGIPMEIIHEAERMHGLLAKKNDETGDIDPESAAQSARRQLVQHLLALQLFDKDDAVLRLHLQQLRDKFVIEQQRRSTSEVNSG